MIGRNIETLSEYSTTMLQYRTVRYRKTALAAATGCSAETQTSHIATYNALLYAFSPMKRANDEKKQRAQKRREAQRQCIAVESSVAMIKKLRTGKKRFSSHR
jgi:hypothetical protein